MIRDVIVEAHKRYRFIVTYNYKDDKNYERFFSFALSAAIDPNLGTGSSFANPMEINVYLNPNALDNEVGAAHFNGSLFTHDSDLDGMDDGAEYALGLDPFDEDSDGDGIKLDASLPDNSWSG